MKAMDALLIIGIGAILGCSRGDLSREEAAEKLRGDIRFTPSRSASRDLEKSAEGLMPARCQWPKGEEFFARRIVSVDGIAETSPSERVVEFKWTWDSSKISPGAFKCLFVFDRAATARFVRFDDGWRVTEVSASDL